MKIENYKIQSKKNKEDIEVISDIDLYRYTEELYNEINELGIIERMKEVPQLGLIKTNKKYKKTRYDYIMLQMYLHKIVKNNLGSSLKYTYNNPVKTIKFPEELEYRKSEGEDKKKVYPTKGEIIQILIFAYNMGHCYNTFTSSKAIIMAANEDIKFKEMIINSFREERFKEVAIKLIEEKNYKRIHLLNSLLILERCNENKRSVFIAKEIIYLYIMQKYESIDSKIEHIFSIFKNVRTLSYIIYDLDISKIPFSIDISKESSMIVFLSEMVSEYNDKRPIEDMNKSITKLLNDNIYNEKSNSICFHQISKKMAKKIINKQGLLSNDYYDDLFLNKDSILNAKQVNVRDYNEKNILKLTFEENEKEVFFSLLKKLDKMKNIRVGYYDRGYKRNTILISITNKKCRETEVKTAFRILQVVIKELRKIKNIQICDERYLLVTKFFLRYFLNSGEISNSDLKYDLYIEPTVDFEKCVFCSRGRKKMINTIDELIKKSKCDEDTIHEAEALKNVLEDDNENDTSICIPASTVVFIDDNKIEKKAEIDGIIIYPMRKEGQVTIIEAKNTESKSQRAKKCLNKRLSDLLIEHNKENIVLKNSDANISLSVN